MAFAPVWKFATGSALMLSTVSGAAGTITAQTNPTALGVATAVIASRTEAARATPTPPRASPTCACPATPSPRPTVTHTCAPAPPPPTCAAWTRRQCRDPQCAVGCSCRLLPCVGDCSGDGRVEVAELIQLVGIAQGSSPLDRCPALQQIPAIGDLVQAVSSALFGCAGPVSYRLLDGSTIVITEPAGSTPITSAMTGVFAVVESEVRTPNTWFELTITRLEFRADDVVVSGRVSSAGCYGMMGVGCLSSLTFEFPPHVYASASATIDDAAVGLIGGGGLDPRIGFPAFLELELCRGAAGPSVSCEAIRSGAEPGWALQLVASRGLAP